SAMHAVWRERARNSLNWVWTVPISVVKGGALILAAHDVMQRRISIGAFVVLLGAIVQLAEVWAGNDDFAIAYGGAALGAVKRLEAAAKPTEPLGSHDPDGVPRVAVRFENVSFRYPGRTEDVLHNLTLDIAA